MTILCIWAWESFRPSVWKRLQKKEWKRKKRYLMFNFRWQKSSQQRKTARYCKIPMKSKIVSFGFSCYIWFGFGCYIWFGFGCYIWFVFGCYIWILHLVVFTRFPANRDCLLKLYMLVKSARTVSRELHWGKHVYIGFTSWLTEGVVTILYFCAKLVFVLFIISLS